MKNAVVVKNTWNTDQFKVFAVKGNAMAGFTLTYKGAHYWEVEVHQLFLFSKERTVKKTIMGLKAAKDFGKQVLTEWAA